MKMVTYENCGSFRYKSTDYLNGEYYGKDSKCVISDLKND